MKSRSIQKYIVPFAALIAVLTTGCNKLVQVPPPDTSITAETVFASDPTAISAVNTLYFDFTDGSPYTSFRLTGLNGLLALSADEMRVFDGQTNVTLYNYYKNKLTALSPSTGTDFWSAIYRILYDANSAIDGLEKSTGTSVTVRKQLLGEAKFFRALYNFYLVNLYGDIPLVLTKDISVNSAASRSPKSAVYEQMISDLTEAKTLLSATYLDAALAKPTSERVRITKWAASALLARVYLYQGSSGVAAAWAKAEAEASAVIDNKALFDLPSVGLTTTFRKNNSEAIWQMQGVSTNMNTQQGAFFTIPATGPATNLAAGAGFVNTPLLSAFETGDPRRTTWIDSLIFGGSTYYYPAKYKVGYLSASITSASQQTEYSTVLRLAEVYLIRAEARAMQNNMSGAASDLNVIRKRARGSLNVLPDISATITSAQMLDAVMRERQTELFTEWGHRWFDLARTGRLEATMKGLETVKGITWINNQALHPIPTRDITLNPNIVQNPGY